MSEQIKIKTSLEHRFNKSINILNNEVAFDSEGTSTIEKSLYLEIKDIDSSISLLEESSTKSKEVSGEQKKAVIEQPKIVEEVVSTEPELQNTTIEETNTNTSNSEETITIVEAETNADTKEENEVIDLSTFSAKELKEMAEAANLPVEEYAKLTKANLVIYLQEKIK